MQYNVAANPYNPYARNKQAQDLRGRSISYSYADDTPPRTGSSEIDLVGWQSMMPSAQPQAPMVPPAPPAQNGLYTAFSNSSSRRPSQPVPPHRDDVVARHLLVETAVLDSQGFELLPIEEVDALKKEKVQLESRLETARRKLALESKVRDAAQSLHRLYGDDIKAPSQPQSKKRGSILGDRGRSLSGSFAAKPHGQAADELAVSQKKIDDLLQILSGLESRRQYVESRLLRHTAAVLQLAHDEIQSARTTSVNGDADMERNLVDSTIDGFLRNGGFEESIYLKDRNGFEAFGGFGQPKSNLNAVSNEKLLTLQGRVDQMNDQMRNLISLVRRDKSPARIESSRPPSRTGDDAVSYLETQVDLVDKNVARLEQECMKVREEREEYESQLARVNNQLFLILSSSNPNDPINGLRSPPMQTNASVQTHLGYLEQHVTTISDALQSQTNTSQRELQDAREQSQAHEDTLRKLWDSISPDNSGDEVFSAEGLHVKVRHMFDKHANMEQQADILRRQIQQQRELNNKSDGEKDKQIGDLQAARADAEKELLELRDKHVTVEAEVLGARSEMSKVSRELENFRSTAQSNEEQKKSVLEQLQKMTSRNQDLEIRVNDYEDRLAEIHDESRAAKMDAEGKIKEHDTRLASLTKELAEARSAHVTASTKMEEKHKEAENLEAEVVRLTTELTMVKAELDGAYGSRAERAKEQASVELAELRKRRDEEQDRMKALETELTGMAQDLQDLTRESIDAEKEREQLEVLADGLRTRCETLETQLSDEKVRWLGITSPTAMTGEGGRELTSASVLRSEFKKMMRETRSEHATILKAEQEERKKLERILRDMKKGNART